VGGRRAGATPVPAASSDLVRGRVKNTRRHGLLRATMTGSSDLAAVARISLLLSGYLW